MTLTASPPVVTPPPRWAVWAAHAVPLVVLPSSLWRIALLLDLPLIGAYHPVTDGMPTAEVIYILLLSLLGEGAALLTLGLVRPWGEVMPRWIPFLGGRPVKPAAAITAACLGSIGVIAICAQMLRGGLGEGFRDLVDAGGRVVLVAGYLPLFAWAPLVLAVTYSYYRRRR